MAGQSETQKVINRARERERLEALLKKGDIGNRSNIIGFQQDRGAKTPSFLGNMFKDFKLPDFPDIKPPDITWLKELFKDKSKWNKVGSFLSNQGQSENE